MTEERKAYVRHYLKHTDLKIAPLILEYISELEKENKIKEEIIIGEQKENAELKAQIEQLSNDNHVLKTSFITQQEQIEKMRCCGNCKFRQKDTLNKRCFECKDVKDGVIRLFHWEFAE